MSISDGVSWENVISPLLHISPAGFGLGSEVFFQLPRSTVNPKGPESQVSWIWKEGVQR